MLTSRRSSGWTPSRAPIRLTTLETTGATFQPAVWKPKVSAVDLGSSSMATTT